MVTTDIHYWQNFGFFSGHVFLDFINTFDDLDKSRELDALPDWITTLCWAKKSSVLNNDEFTYLTKKSKSRLTQTELSRLHALRQTGWRIFGPVSEHKRPDKAALDALNQHIQFSYSKSSLNYLKNRFDWTVNIPPSDVDIIRIRLGLAVARLLTDATLSRLSQCHSCTGLFINQGRGVGRKWCRMSSCGNRAKIRKFRSIKSD